MNERMYLPAVRVIERRIPRHHDEPTISAPSGSIISRTGAARAGPQVEQEREAGQHHRHRPLGQHAEPRGDVHQDQKQPPPRRKRSLSAKNTSVSDMKAVIQMSMKMRRAEHEQARQRRRGRAPQRKAAPRPAGPSDAPRSCRARSAARDDHHAPSAIARRSTPTDTPNSL